MAVLSIVLAASTACSGGGGGGTPKPDAIADGFDRTALLDHLGHKVLLPMQEAFATKAAALPAAVDAYCDALEAGNVGTTSDAARAAWREAMVAWQRADAVLVGPAAMDNKTLRDRIYGWPLLSTCGLDRDTAASWANPAAYDVATKLANVRSLASIEYLLFATNTIHNCPTTPTGWDAIGASLPLARCRQAHAIAIDVAAQGATLQTAWRADGGNYAGVLARAGQSGSPFASAHAAVNEVSNGLFYVDKMVKDMKLAEAAGIAVNACGTTGELCLVEVEAPFADYSAFTIRANLDAVRQVFTGTTATADGPGFDDFLKGVGANDVADRMTMKLDGAVAAAAALPDSYVSAIMTDRDKVVAAHAALRMFTDDLKSQFLTLLALDIPDDVATDND
jgi:predicted lipoprotein